MLAFRKVAAQMWRYARANPRRNNRADLAPYRCTYGSRLQLVLHLDAKRQVFLSAARPEGYPPERELAAIRRDFEVPATARESRKKTGEFYTVCFSWQDGANQARPRPTATQPALPA